MEVKARIAVRAEWRASRNVYSTSNKMIRWAHDRGKYERIEKREDRQQKYTL